MRIVWAVILSATAAAGCGYNTGFVHDATSGDQHEYRMDVASVRYARTVYGQAEIGALFCLLPFGRGLYRQAMEELNATAHLRDNEVLENVRTDDDPLCGILYGVRRLTISADVYELTPTHEPTPAAVRVITEPSRPPLNVPPPPAQPPPQATPPSSTPPPTPY
jgi:hypothetical protein